MKTPMTNIIANLQDNPILRTDSYKASHWLQYPPGTDGSYAYIESRGGEIPYTVLFGLQAYVIEYLSRRFTQAHIDAAEAFWQAHGEPFNKAGWELMLKRYGGALPVSIRALPEGSVVPLRTPLVTIESTDPDFPWLPSYMETELLRAVWYPTTVATISRRCKEVIMKSLIKTSDDPAGQIPFKLHDFGSRGVSSLESAALGGAAHLVNFMGSDTVTGVLAANAYYGADMAAFSIPAAEHSTITSWGRDGEVEAYRNMIRQYGKPGALFAVVSDSYDIFTACEKLWGDTLKQQVIDSGATLVVRPDSGDPVTVVVKVIGILAAKFGTTTNSKGYRVLNNVRVLQGDGVNPYSIERILAALEINGFAADNVAFGMGGALLQQLNRDTFKFAMKTSAASIKGQWRDVFKDPITDAGKVSKKGRVDVYSVQGELVTGLRDEPGKTSAMREIYRNGELLVRDTLEAIRARAAVV